MDFYEHNNRRGRGWAAFWVGVYLAVLVGVMFLTYTLLLPRQEAFILVDFLAPSEAFPASGEPAPVEPVLVVDEPDAPAIAPVQIETVAEAETEQEPQIDQRALFPGSATTTPSTSSEVSVAESTSQGFSLEGRYLVGNLPRPSYDVDAEGRVVIRISVNSDGVVTGADYEQAGSTTNHATLVAAARAAALKARFTAAEADLQTGTITYIFRLN